MNLSTIIKQPLLTEKTLQQAKELGFFTVIVDASANKNQIKQALKEFFSLDCLNLKTSRLKGRSRRSPKTRSRIFQTPIKKAIFQLKKGQVFPGYELPKKKKTKKPVEKVKKSKK
jgi:large subunit ribosomal protein L23